MHRRAVVTLAVLAMQELLSLGPSIVPASECAAADAARAPPRAGAALPYMLNACSPGARTLLQTIPVMPFGAPATDATIEVALAQDIERQAVALERGSQSLATSTLLPGSWRLLYSNAREIRNLAGGLPLGFVLGRVYQPLDPAGGRFENQVCQLFCCLVVLDNPAEADAQQSQPGLMSMEMYCIAVRGGIHVSWSGIRRAHLGACPGSQHCHR